METDPGRGAAARAARRCTPECRPRSFLGLAAMRVAVEDHAGRVAIDRLLEPARPEERIDLARLAVDGVDDGRIVQEHDAARCPQARQCRLELQGLVDRFAHEDLRRPFAPRLERALAEAAGEALGAGEADAGDLDSRTVQ